MKTADVETLVAQVAAILAGARAVPTTGDNASDRALAALAARERRAEKMGDHPLNYWE